jgi:uncharacterized protein YdhG (YjbR/CyaY superfamily)
MVQSKAATTEEYLAQLPEERRDVVTAVLNVVRKHLPKGYVEEMNWGAITWAVPLSTFPKTYNKQPLCYAALAAQKNHYALYLMCAYMDPKQTQEIEDAFVKAGKKLDMGKSCLRFKKLDDLPLDALGEVIGSTTPAEFIEKYVNARGGK